MSVLKLTNRIYSVGLIPTYASLMLSWLRNTERPIMPMW